MTLRCIAGNTLTICPCTDSADLDVLGFVPGDLIDLLRSDGSISLRDLLDDPGRLHIESVDQSRSCQLFHCAIAV